MARPACLLTLMACLWACDGKTEQAAAEGDKPSSSEVTTKGPPEKQAGASEPEKDIPVPPDVAAPPADAPKTESGLATKVLAKGKGDTHPQPQDKVKVHYTGWTTDGKMFDSSVKRGRPSVFGVKQVIPGWTEGLQLMVEGEKRRMWIPAKLAYEGRHGPQGMLVFDVELLDITPGPKPIPAPEDVAVPSN